MWRQLADLIGADIQSGRYAPGELLPSEVQLGARYGVSRPTVRQALAALSTEGLIEARNGIGSQVCQTPPAAIPQTTPQTTPQTMPHTRTSETTSGPRAGVVRPLAGPCDQDPTVLVYELAQGRGDDDGGAARAHQVARAMLAAAVVDLPRGGWDEQVLTWLARWDISVVATVASLMHRCRLAGAATTPAAAGSPLDESEHQGGGPR
jgi:DNA-binding transcriptional regulator YhcF (GntR family)